jgi:RNA ligase-like protein
VKPPAIDKLLTRDEFRAAVFARDRGLCVVCSAPTDSTIQRAQVWTPSRREVPAVDAHHIVERRLWPDSGYYLDNGASVCGDCHLRAEQTILTCDELRALCGIKRVLLPPHLYVDAEQPYDKWGNPILPNGQRLRGELFDDESVQKVLAPVLHLFTSRVKYPRTFHVPWSPGVTDDDRVMDDPDAAFGGAQIVVTEKADGENTTFYRDYLHARSTDYSPHPSRDRVRALHASIAHDIPDGWRICGENVYAQHSIAYAALPAYFLVFSIWNERNECLPWDETVLWATLLGLSVVPVIYRGLWHEAAIRTLNNVRESWLGGEREGYVVRLAAGFHYRAFRRSVAKYVRANHVQTHGGWAVRAVVPNRLREEAP